MTMPEQSRYEICTRHNIPFKTVQKEFTSRDDVLLWMIDTQFSRRNLSAPDRILLAQKKAPILERMAREKQLKTLKQNTDRLVNNDKTELKQPESTKPIEQATENRFIHLDKTDISEQPKTAVPEKSKAVEPPKPVIEKKPEPPKPVHVQKEIAKIAGVSSFVYAAVMPVEAP